MAPDRPADEAPTPGDVRPRPNRRRKKTPAQIKPSRRLELRYFREGYALILGVDEVGVASASGPVFACALAMPMNRRQIKGVRDSKTLSAAERERLDPLIRRQALRLGVGAASVTEIDRLNIYHATHLAMKRAIARAGAHDFVIVDGNRIRGFEEHAGPYRAMVDADALCYAVSCASIVAKVARDGLMRRSGRALSRLRLGPQRRLPDARPPARPHRARDHAPPPPLVHHRQACRVRRSADPRRGRGGDRARRHRPSVPSRSSQPRSGVAPAG